MDINFVDCYKCLGIGERKQKGFLTITQYKCLITEKKNRVFSNLFLFMFCNLLLLMAGESSYSRPLELKLENRLAIMLMKTFEPVIGGSRLIDELYME